MSTYRFFLEPIGHEADEAIADLLNQQGDSAASQERRKVRVEGRLVEVMYEVPRHSILTIAGHSIHKKHFRAYVQEDGGELRPYALYKDIGKKLAKTKEVKRMKRALKEKTEQR